MSSSLDEKKDWLARLGVTALPAGTAPGAPAGAAAAGDAGKAAEGEPPAVPPVLTHETEAKQPSNRKRTKLGVGERVQLTVKPGPGKWKVSKGTLSQKTGSTVIFTADDKPGKAEVTVTVQGLEDTVEFTVVAPDSVVMEVRDKRHNANGRPNGGIHTLVYIGPADVSFSNIELLELEIGASASGYWGALNGKGHHPNSEWGPMTDTVVAGKGTKWLFMDNCAIWGGAAAPPWTGSATFRIPWKYHVDSGGGTTFETVIQSMDTDKDGTTTVSKGGASHSFALTDGDMSYRGAPY